jgi:spore coat protein U-like protein
VKPGHLCAISLAILAAAMSAFATTANAAVTCGVSITVPADFGDYDVFAAAPDNVTGKAHINCTLMSGSTDNVSYTLELSAGDSNAFLPSRQMANGPTNRLNYNLYINASHSRVWGDGSGGTRTVSGKIKLTSKRPAQSKNRSIYGQIPAGQDAATGNYSDMLIMTMTF